MKMKKVKILCDEISILKFCVNCNWYQGTNFARAYNSFTKYYLDFFYV